jgi:hypothetical protein
MEGVGDWTEQPRWFVIINLLRNWKAMGFQTPCLIHFSKEDLRRHRADADGWNEVQDFWDSIRGIMGRAGWTSHETYDQTAAIYSRVAAEISSGSNVAENCEHK